MKGNGLDLEREVARVVAPLAGSRMLATVSGGADSVALLVALRRLGADVVAAHCNFHLRGAESDRDARFVANLCQRLGVKLHTVDFDVDAYRREHGGSMEMACRQLRYDWFDRLVTELGCARILTAHHADDNVETMLLNLLRGCGLEGAKGMLPDNGRVMRPLLRLHRADIEAYLCRLGQDWIVDSTNLGDEPDRNFLRLNVLPLLEKRFPDASRRLARSRQNLAEDFLLFLQWRDEHTASDTLYIRELSASASPTALLHQWLRGTTFTAAQQAEMLRESARPGSGTRQWQAGDRVVLLGGDALRHLPTTMPPITLADEELHLTPAIFSAIKGNADRGVAYFPRPLSHYRLRTPLPGERMRISTRATRKVSDLLAEADVPMPYRHQYPLLADPDTDEPLWLPFVRRAHAGLLTPASPACHRLTASR